MRKQSGFTLIELMIVVAIVGILAAIAIPAYKDYTVRAKVSECAAAISACKASVTEYYNTETAMPADVDAAGCSTNASQWCSALDVANTGAISSTVDAATGIDAACDLILTPDLAVNEITGWTGSTDCTTKYVPANFR
ncbi:MAG: prepilin-type N-terminal cleavage/methylation domain-containing protein [Candidatus Thiodiazotropha endolucinida]